METNETIRTATTNVEELNAFQLADWADTFCPDKPDSVGAHFLTRIRDDAVEGWEWLIENGDHLPEEIEFEDLDDLIHERADSAVPIYTFERWTVFTELGAYTEEVNELGPIEDMTDAAGVALYMIAERLLRAVFEDIIEEQGLLTNDE